MALEEKQFELGGVTFGLDCPVHVTDDGWSPGTPTRSSGDTELAGMDGVRFGRQFDRSSTWSFKMFSNCDSEESAWEAIEELGNAWSGDEIRTNPDLVMPLRYRVAKGSRVIYGRPERWTPVPNNLSLGGRIDVAADFRTVCPLVFEDDLQSVEIGMSAPLDPEAGLIPPFIPPVTLGAGDSYRVDQVRIGGKKPTPMRLIFKGPISGAKVETSLWTCELLDDVGQEKVVVDARPWVRSAELESGGGVRINPRVTRISQLWLPPGNHDVTFTGTDPTGTATVTIEWLNASRSPR